MPLRFYASFLAMSAAIGGPAFAEDAKPFRIDEALKTPDWLTISGSQRTRYETLGNQFRAGGSGGDQLLSLRTTLMIEAKFDDIRFVTEVWDARTYLGDSGTPLSTSTTNPLEPIQAFVEFNVGDAFGEGSTTKLLGGRHTLDLGSRRLVGRNNFPMTTNAFTGVVADYTAKSGDRLVAFYSLPQRRQPTSIVDLENNKIVLDDESFDQQFWGAHATRAKFAGPTSAELFYFGLKESDDGAFQSRDRDIHTVGARIFSKPKAGVADIEFEGGYQFGAARSSTSAANVTDLDVKAYYAHAEAGYTFDASWAPRLALEFDYATGDEDPLDGEYNRFDTLYGPRNGDFGPSGIFGPTERSNIVALGVRLEAAPSKRIDGYLHYAAVFLEEEKDAFGQTRVVDPIGISGDFAAHHVEGRVRYWLVPQNVRLDVGGGFLLNGEFLEAAPNASRQGDTAYLYADVEFTF